MRDMQSELLEAVRDLIRDTDTALRYSAWRHGPSEVEVVFHSETGEEHHLGYVSTTREVVQILQTTEARHGTDDTD